MSERIWDDGLDVPLIVSVTGHVDIPDGEIRGVRDRIEGFLEDLRQRYPRTRIVMISALAEGADILAAEVAMDAGIRVAPVIPKLIDEYRSGFADRGYAQRFDAILSDTRTYTPYIIRTESESDRDSYRNLSAYLIFNSHIMLALWDGRRYDRNGGTYDTLRMAYAGVDTSIRRRYQESVVGVRSERVRLRHLDAPEDCLVYRLQVGRAASREELQKRGCLDPDDIVRGDGYIVPLTVRGTREGEPSRDTASWEMNEEFPELYDTMFSRLDALNADMGAVPDGGGVRYVQGMAAQNVLDAGDRSFGLIGKEEERGEYERRLLEGGRLDASASRYAVADSLALENQSVSFSRIRVMIAVAALTGLAFSLFILSGGSLLVNMVYTVLMLAGIVLSRDHLRRKTYSKFIEYRALAESMRVEFYRGMLGSREPVPDLCYGYMKNELLWIRSVLKSWNSFFMNDLPDPGDGAVDAVVRCWVDDQKSYHEGKKFKNARALERSGRRAKALVLATTVTSAVLIPLMAVPGFLGHSLFTVPPVYVLGVCMAQGMEFTVSTAIRALMIVLVALTSYYTLGISLIHGGTPEQIDAKVQMFSIARIRMEGVDDDTRREILWELGDQCIEENNDWVFEHRSKDFKGGNMNVSPVEVDA